jgi:hypothetical protein
VASRLTAAFDKPTLAPGVLVFAVAILAVGYRMAAWASRWPAARWFAPVATIGRHGLDSYVIATMATIVVPATIRFPQSGWFAQVLAVAVLLAAFLWARLREGGHGRRSGAAPPVGPLVSAQGSLRPVRTSPEDR